MSNKAIVKCPFIISMGRKAIECEGITDDNFLRLVFKSEEFKRKHQIAFCGAEYKKCMIYKMLEAKYEET